MRSFRELVEDALKIKIVPNKGIESQLPITGASEDIANKQIKDSDSGSFIDVEAIQKFRTLSSNRMQKYQQFEEILSDATISAAVEMYADDSTQYDYHTGKIIWAESDDREIEKAANRLIDILRINDNAWKYIYSLCAYGDVYLRLYRSGDESDYNELFDTTAQNVIKVKPQDSSRKLEEYVEYVDDPATIYDLQVRDKTAGFIRMINIEQNSSPQLAINDFGNNVMTFSDVNVYDRTSFVHICLSGNISRNPELIKVHSNANDTTNVYKVKTGKSILEDAYEATQTVKLLEDSMMLSRVTKSALIRIIQIEVGNLPKPETEALLRRVKNMIEQKIALNKNTGTASSYNSPGPMENNVYLATHDGKGVVTTNTLGGDVNIKDIVDVEYFNNKKLSALKIPKQFLNYDSPEGLGNGTSLTKISARYAHTIMRIQKAFISGVTSILNLQFLDKDLDYINKFTIKMVSPATIEDTDRDEQMSTRLQHASDIISLVEGSTTEKGVTEVKQWLLSNYLSLSDISDIIQNNSDDSGEADSEFEDDSDLGDFGGSPMNGLDEMPPFEESDIDMKPEE